jgi:TetR/AcrR family transcriptional regulator, regulator of cefoperazone and chloramphenicol sensitivity
MLTPDDAKTRLLQAAEVVFADKGFKAASVREICKLAQANVAAVNYYFGDKERLYIETVKYAYLSSCADGFPLPEWGPDVPAEQKLREFIRVMVMRMLRPPRPTSQQLMMRELADPSAACVEWVQEYIRPMAETLRSILGELLPDADHERVYLTGFSIVAQWLFYKQNRPIVGLLMGEEAFARVDVDRLADHITAFVLGGLGLRAGRPQAVGGPAS